MLKQIKAQLEQSLAASTLLRFAIRITAVVLVVAGLSYLHVVDKLEAKTHAELQSYIAERGQKESAIFKLAKANHETLKQAFLKLWQTEQQQAAERFTQYFERSPDGATRTLRSHFDGIKRSDGSLRSGVTGFVARSNPVHTPQLRSKMVLCLELIDRFGPAWQNRFADTYCHTPDGAAIVYWPGLPWAFETPADFNVLGEEWSYIADQKHNPQRKTVWTGLYYDPSAKTWMASVETPIDLNGRHLITMGHDILLNDMVQNISRDKLAGTYNFIFRQDGRLIAHPHRVADLGKDNHPVDIQSSKDPQLRSIYRQIMAQDARLNDAAWVMNDQVNDNILAITRIDGPQWLLVTVYPRALLSSTATEVAGFILGLSLLSLLLELAMLQLVMHGRVIAPLKAFMRASEAVARGDYRDVASGLVSLPEDRRDEVGRLARTFRDMSMQVEQSHADLEASEQRYRGVFNDTWEVIFISGPGGRLIDINPAVAAVFGYSREQALQMGAAQFYENVAERAIVLDSIAQGGFVRNYPVRMRHQDGHILEVLLTASLRKDEQGRVCGLQGMLRDVTEQRSAERLQERYQEQLELQVKERTQSLHAALQQLRSSNAELETQRAQVASLLDNSGQGFLSFGENLLIDGQCSRACISMLGRHPAGCNAAQLLFADSHGQQALLHEVCEKALQERNILKRKMMLSLLPYEFNYAEKLFKASYSVLESGHLMVVLTDITQQHRLAEQAQAEARRLQMIVAAVSEGRDFFGTINEIKAFIHQQTRDQSQDTGSGYEIYRALHTFKGQLNQYGFELTPRLLHEYESDLADGLQSMPPRLLAVAAYKQLSVALERDLETLRSSMGQKFVQGGGGVLLSPDQAKELEKLAIRLQASQLIEERDRVLLQGLSQLSKQTLLELIQGFERVVQQAAERQDKPMARLRCQGDPHLSLDAARYRPLLSALGHAFRNAVVHGIETAALRAARGKPNLGQIECRWALHGDLLQLQIQDDGDGINLEALKAKARERMTEDIDAMSEPEAMQLVFEDQLSTAQGVDELAGRGVGLSALRQAVQDFGGWVRVESEAGRGCTICITLPWDRS